MNNILEYFETESFNELMQFTIEEVREVFNLFEYYVPQKDLEPFIIEGTSLKTWYTNELNKIDVLESDDVKGLINYDALKKACNDPQFIKIVNKIK